MSTQPNCHLLEPLTDREQHILELMDDGLTNAEIARKLALAETTVRDYRQNIYDKLGLEGEHRKKRYALHCARQLGLIESNTPTSDLSISALITRAKHNLPASMTPFIGRVEDIVKIQQHLETYRLITILSPGGMGKTRLALEVARTQIDNFNDGVYFVPLQALSESSQIAAQVASSVSMPSQDGDVQKLVLQFLGNKNILLVIDNFEHLLEGAPFLSEILKAAPDVKILVTSRERMKLSAESSYSLQGLDDDALDSDAVKLFVQTAQRINNTWQLTDENAEAVQHLIALAGGMPLAIILAASWLDVLSLEEIIIEIEHGLDVLQTDLLDVPERHRSVGACFKLTWNRLTPNEQSVFMKMSVFRGGFTREAAEAVTGANLRILQSLMNKALIQKDANARYDLHELLRQFAEAQLDASGEFDAVRDAHMRYYAEAYIRDVSQLEGANRFNVLKDLDRDFENHFLMWKWATQNKLWRFLAEQFHSILQYEVPIKHTPMHIELLDEWMASLENLAPWTHEQEQLFVLIAPFFSPYFFEISQKQYESNLRQARLLAVKHGDRKSVPKINNELANVLTNQNQLDEAKALYEEGLNIAYELEDPRAINNVLLGLGYYLLLGERNLQAGLQNRMQLLEFVRKHELIREIAPALIDIALIYQALDKWGDAQKSAEDAFQLSIQNMDDFQQIRSLRVLQYQSVTFMQLDIATNYLEQMSELSQYRNIAVEKKRLEVHHSHLLFAKGSLDNTLDLLEPFHSHVKQNGQLDEVNLVARCKALYNSLLGNFAACIEDLPHVIPYDLQYSWNSHLIIDCMIFLPMLQDQDDDIRSVELIAMMNEHPKALPISNQHPYVLELEAELRERLDKDIYQQAWGRGAQLDPLVIAPALMEEFTAIYG